MPEIAEGRGTHYVGCLLRAFLALSASFIVPRRAPKPGETDKMWGVWGPEGTSNKKKTKHTTRAPLCRDAVSRTPFLWAMVGLFFLNKIKKAGKMWAHHALPAHLPGPAASPVPACGLKCFRGRGTATRSLCMLA